MRKDDTMKTTKNAFAAQLLGYIAGIGKHYAGQTLLLDGQNITAAQLVTLFQACADTADAAKQAETDRAAAVAKATAAMQQAKPMAKAFKATVLAAFGGDVKSLGDFDLTPLTVTPAPAEVKAAAVKKAASTRKALGTMGSQQKKDAKKALAAQETPAVATPPVAPVTPKA
jgi:hypothetical protein